MRSHLHALLSRRASCLLVAAVALGPTSALAAADKVFDARGFVAEREFSSQLPYEHVDTMTGNLLLTFTDLVLPGNAGFELRIQRTYNSKIYEDYTSFGPGDFVEDSWAGLGWSLHFGRVSHFPSDLSLPGPLIEMPDGSKHQAYPHLDGVPGHYMTRQYWTYDDSVPDPVLRLPNGVTYTFGRFDNGPGPGEVRRYVTRIADPFDNAILINYASAPAPRDVITSVVQTVGADTTRTVTFGYDETMEEGGTEYATWSLRSMTFEDRTWTYRQKRVSFLLYTALFEVQPPVGPPWRFDYNESTPNLVSWWLMSRLTTPGGAEIEYTYARQLFQVGSGVIYTPSLKTRSVSGPGIANGTWQYQYRSDNWRDPVQSTVVSPCGTTTRYTFKAIGPEGQEEPWAIGSMRGKETEDASGVLETESLFWTRSTPISNFPESGNSFRTHVPLLQGRIVERAGSDTNYVTWHYYDAAAYSPTRARNFNDFGKPMATAEAGELGRVTYRGYAYPSGGDPGFSTYIVDRLWWDRVEWTVGDVTESFDRGFAHDPGTGFKTAESVYGVVTQFQPDPYGNVARVEDANGNATRYEYDWGVAKRTITPEYTISRQINSDGTVASETRRGFTTQFQYDALSRVVLVDPPVGLNVATEYDNVHGRSSIVRRGVSVLTTRLNGLGQTVESENGVGVMTKRRYDACGRPVYQSYPFYNPNSTGGTTEFGTTTSYDGLGRVTRRVHPDGHDVTYEHEGIDLTITDEKGNQTQQYRVAFGSPDDGRLLGVVDAGDGVTAYWFNLLGSLSAVWGPGTAQRAWLYNVRNQLVLEAHPENGLTAYSYYPAGNLQARQDGQFGVTSFEYDGNLRLKKVDRPGTAYDTTIGYDPSDNRTSLVNGHVASQFTYDGANRLTSRTDVVNGRSFTTGYVYNDTTAWNGNLRRLVYPSGRAVEYDYDKESRITKVTGAGRTLANDFDYHASGAARGFTTGNGLRQDFTYDERQRLKRIDSHGVLHLHYHYDPVGNIDSIDDARLGMDQAFDHDPLDRLTVANGPWGSGGFTYDAQGNRRSKTIASASTIYHYDATRNRLESSSGAEAATFGYDANGNLRQAAGGTYTFAPTNLTETATVGGQTSTYRYDGDDLRKVRIADGQTHLYLHGPGNQILTEVLDKPTGLEPVRDYVYAGARLVAAIKPPTLTVAPAALQFAALAGGPRTPTQKVRVETAGGSLVFSAVASAPWLSLSTATGATPANLLVSVNPAALAPGNHAGQVTIAALGARGSPQVVPVNVLVVQDAELQASPQSLYFEATAAAAEASAAPALSGAPAAFTAESLRAMPLVFDENRGQTASSVRFLARGAGYGLFLSPGEVVVGLVKKAGPSEAGPARDAGDAHLQARGVRMRFEGGNPAPRLTGVGPLPGRSHYYRGKDPEAWVTDVPQFERVTYEQVYPGVDVVFYGNQRQLEYDLVLAPGADPGQVRLAFKGADGLRLDPDGDLVLAVGDGEVRQRQPVVYQDVAGERLRVAGRYRLNEDGTVGFEVGDYDPNHALVVDPVLSYFTYLGGAVGGDESHQGVDQITDIAVAGGFAYVTGGTTSMDFPLVLPDDWTGQEALRGYSDAFVAKVGPSGSSLVYSTYIGGTARESGLYIALAPAGAFVLGSTSSFDFPTTEDAFQSVFAGPYGTPEDERTDLFVVKVGSTGELLFSSYLGGYSNERASGLVVDGGGAFVTGHTDGNLPVRNAAQPLPSALGDAFVGRINPSGSTTVSSLPWLTYLGGDGGDSAASLALGPSGGVYVLGTTNSTDFPTEDPFQPSLNRGAPPSSGNHESDVFLTRFNSTGSIVYSTYLGGTKGDSGSAIAVGAAGQVYIVGMTSSPDYPLENPMQAHLAGKLNPGPQDWDSFATKLDVSHGSLGYSTFLGAEHDWEEAAVDGSGSLFMVTDYGEGPIVNPFRPSGGGLVAKLAPDGSKYLFSSRLGGRIHPNAMALDGVGNVFLAGSTFEPDQATAGAFQTDLRGNSDGFVLKLTGTGGSGGSTILQQGLLIKDRVLPTGPAWTASENTPWLEISDGAGVGPSVVLATVDTTGLVPGTYTGAITVAAADAVGSPKEVAVTLEVKSGVPQPVQVVPGGPYFGQVVGQSDHEIEFDGSASVDPAGTIQSYLWDFGDGATGYGPKVKHSFTTPGNQTVTLTVKGYSGASATGAPTVYVNVPPVANLAGPLTGVTDQILAFDATSSFDPDGSVVGYFWTFGDGATGVGPTFVHSYSAPGQYTVELWVVDDDGASVMASITVGIAIGANEPPVARPGGPYGRRPGESVLLNGTASTDADGTIASWSWDLGDGRTEFQPIVSATYEVPGVYTVSLTVTDNFGATGTATTQVHVGDFTVTPADLSFRVVGGEAAPQVLTLSFPSPLAWEATEGESWLSLDASNGTTPSTITVSVDANGLDPGTRQGTISVRPVGLEVTQSLVRNVPVELVVEPPAGTCAAEAWFCEPFDELTLGDLAGQNGWEATPEAITRNQVVEDTRPGAGAKVLRFETPADLLGEERVNFPERSLDDTEITLEVMVEGVPPGQLPGHVDLLGLAGVGGWGVEGRCFGSLLIGESLQFRDGESTYVTLLETLEPGRWYVVRLLYRNGDVEGSVDGQVKFRVGMNGIASDFAGLAVRGLGSEGTVSIDLLQVKPYVPPPIEGELVVEPEALTLYDDRAGTGISHLDARAHTAPPAARVAVRTAKPRLSAPVTEPRRAVQPLAFEPNLGQSDAGARFVARGRGYSILVSPGEAKLRLPGPEPTEVRIRFEGGRNEVELRGLDEQPGRSHYLVGRDPSRWRRDIPHFARVEMRQVYPGIDAVLYGDQGRLEYDLVLAPGADPRIVRVAFDGIEGLRLDPGGDLVLQTSAGELRHRKPVVYQLVDGQRRVVEAGYRVTGERQVAFHVAAYDPELPLTIDPTLVYSTYLGGVADDRGYAVAVDLAGHAYVAGTTSSVDFPVASAYRDSIRGTSDVFITKFSVDGSTLVYSTFLGGLLSESASALVVDSQGNVYVGGTTASSDFPIANAYQPECLDSAFLLKLDASGTSLHYSTCFGASAPITALALAPAGHVSVTGWASGWAFIPPIQAAFSFKPSGASTSAFVARFDQAGQPVFSTYLGGGAPTGSEEAYSLASSVAVDAAGDTYVTGNTNSDQFPITPGAFQEQRGGFGTSGPRAGDAFVARFATGGNLTYSTYLGGTASDAGQAIAVDGSGSMYVAGASIGPDFPTENPFRTFHGGLPNANGPDGFVAKIEASGSALAYSSYLGEPYFTNPYAIAVDSSGAATVGGQTALAPGAGDIQALLARVNPAGTGLDYVLRLGGSGTEVVHSLVLDGAGDAYATGFTTSSDFATVGPFQATYGGVNDAFVLRLSEETTGPQGLLHLAPGYWVGEQAGPAVVTVGRIGGSLGAVTVDYATSGGTASAPWEFAPQSGSLAFGDGETTKAFTVPVFHNQVSLGDKSFGVSLTNPTGGAVLGRSTAEVTILEADPRPTGVVATFRVRDRLLPVGPAWTAEVDVPWLTLSSYSGTGPTVVTVTADPTALGGGDYTGQITITANAAESPKVIPVLLRVICGETCSTASPASVASPPSPQGSAVAADAPAQGGRR